MSKPNPKSGKMGTDGVSHFADEHTLARMAKLEAENILLRQRVSHLEQELVRVRDLVDDMDAELIDEMLEAGKTLEEELDD